MSKRTKHTSTARSGAITWVGSSVVVLGLAIAAGIYWNSVVTVQQVRFEGNHFVSIDELSSIDVPTGTSPDSINFVDLENQFETIPYVKRAVMNVEPNGDLLVEITEREPIALLIEENPPAYIDQDGLKLPVIQEKNVDVPILYGFATTNSDTVKSNQFQVTADFLTSVKKASVTNATISEVIWSSTEGIIAMTNDQDVKVTFGKGDFENRIRNWEAFYKEIVKQKGMAAMNSIDLRFKGQIVTRERH
jgi:cell division septal protein FtsQ